MSALRSKKLAQTPIAVIDFETTGLTPGHDRVIEVSVVRIEPGQEPELVFDTLVNPRRRVSATDIHGITDSDVASAPEFRDIAGDFVDAISGCAVGAYNVYFDIGFLESELADAGVQHGVPHFCLMYMRPMLGLGKRCKLDIACQEMGIDYSGAHVASADAMAAGQLMQRYLQHMQERKLETFGDLARLKDYKFTSSFDFSPISPAADFGLAPIGVNESRVGFSLVKRAAERAQLDARRRAFTSYWDALRVAVSDLEISPEEVAELQSIKMTHGLNNEQIRAMHARLFAAVTVKFAADTHFDDDEARRLRQLRECLSQLGWAPGD